MDAKSPAKGEAMFPKEVYTQRASQGVRENSPHSRLPPGDIIPCVSLASSGAKVKATLPRLLSTIVAFG